MALALLLVGLAVTVAVALNRGGTSLDAAEFTTTATTNSIAPTSTSTGSVSPSPSTDPAGVTVAPETTQPPGPTGTVVPGGGTSAPSSGTTVETAPPPPALSPGRIELSSAVVDLGATTATARLVVTNIGETPVVWTFDDGGGAAPLLWSAEVGPLASGERGEVRFTIDRRGLPEGDIVRTFTVGSDGDGGGSLEVRAAVEHAPRVTIAGAPSTLSCPFSVTPPVTVDVADESAIASVALRWSGPGPAGERALVASATPGRWQGRLGIAEAGGTWRYDAVATDVWGNVARAAGTILVAGC